MNYYFLLEDEKSLIKVLPKWFEHIGFKCIRVADIKSVEKNNYILQSGKGVTRLITNVLFDTINTIKNNPGKIDKLVIIIEKMGQRKAGKDKYIQKLSKNMSWRVLILKF